MTLSDLEKEKISEMAELAIMQEELDLAQKEYEDTCERMNDIEQSLPELECRVKDAVERESEAIRISNSKNPQIEELGKWWTIILTIGSRRP